MSYLMTLKKHHMRTVCAVFFLFLSNATGAQSYVPMLSDSTVWKISAQFEGCHTNTLFVSGDTLIGNHTYENLKGINTPGASIGTVLWLREDTAARKVYARKRSPSWANDTAEFILYDFALQPGDSILLYNAWFNGAWYLNDLDTIGWVYLDSITLANTMSGLRKKFHFTKVELTTTISQNGMEWIEGIGAINGSYLLGYAETLAINWLDCAYSGIIQLYDGSPFGPADGVCFCDWDDIKNVSNDTNVEVYPVPADLKIFVTRHGGFEAESIVKLCDATGQTLMSQPLSTVSQFDISTLSPGVYFLNFHPYRKAVKFVVSR